MKVKKTAFDLKVIKNGVIVVFQQNNTWYLGRVIVAAPESLKVMCNALGDEVGQLRTITPDIKISEVVFGGDRFFGSTVVVDEVFDISSMSVGDIITYRAASVLYTGKLLEVSPELISICRYCSLDKSLITVFAAPADIEILQIWR